MMRTRTAVLMPSEERSRYPDVATSRRNLPVSEMRRRARFDKSLARAVKAKLGQLEGLS